MSGAGANRDLVDIEAFRERLTLHLENASFAGASASYFSVDNEFYWFSAGLTWADMQTIAVRLTLSVPGIDSITFSDAGTDGTYGIGDAVTATVTFNEAVTVTGTPQLEIDAGGTPETLGYSSGSGTAALVFTGYTVAAGEEDTDGLAVAGNKLTLDGGTIKATAGGNPDAVLDHDAVPASANHRVDGVKPTLVTTGGGAPKPSSDGTKVILTFSEAIGSVDRTRITVKSGTTTLSTTADSMSGATVEITLTTALTSSDTSVTVELAADAVEDLAGNGIAAVAATTVSVEDNTPPTLTGASTVSNDLVAVVLRRSARLDFAAGRVRLHGQGRGTRPPGDYGLVFRQPSCKPHSRFGLSPRRHGDGQLLGARDRPDPGRGPERRGVFRRRNGHQRLGRHRPGGAGVPGGNARHHFGGTCPVICRQNVAHMDYAVEQRQRYHEVPSAPCGGKHRGRGLDRHRQQ